MLALKSVGAVALFGIFNAAEGRLMMAPTPGSSAPDISNVQKMEKHDEIAKACLMGKNGELARKCFRKISGQDMTHEEIIEKFMNHKGFVTQAVREHCPDLENKMETCWTEYGKGK